MWLLSDLLGFHIFNSADCLNDQSHSNWRHQESLDIQLITFVEGFETGNSGILMERQGWREREERRKGATGDKNQRMESGWKEVRTVYRKSKGRYQNGEVEREGKGGREGEKGNS